MDNFNDIFKELESLSGYMNLQPIEPLPQDNFNDIYKELESLSDYMTLQPIEPLPQDTVPFAATPSIEIDRYPGASVAFHIFSYKEHMAYKRREMHKWAAAKLTLSEKLVRSYHQSNSHMYNSDYYELDTEYFSDGEEILKDMKEHDQLETYRTHLIRLMGGWSTDIEPATLKRKKKTKKNKSCKKPKVDKNNNKIR